MSDDTMKCPICGLVERNTGMAPGPHYRADRRDEWCPGGAAQIGQNLAAMGDEFVENFTK